MRLSLSITLLLASAVALASCASQPRASAPDQTRWTTIASSVQGRPLLAATFGPSDAPRLLLVGGIHGDEPEGLFALDDLAVVFARQSHAHVRFIRDLNPDATASRTRFNANNIDLNRNFPASNFTPAPQRGTRPLSEPESRALAAELDSFRPDLIVVFHSIRTGPFVNFDGPAERFAQAFAQAAATADPRWHVRPSMGYPTPGSLGTFAGIDRRIPILTIEFDRGQDEHSVRQSASLGVRAVLEALSRR